MKKLLTLIIGAVLFLCFAGTGSASLFSDTQHQNIWLNSNNTSNTWSFDLDNDALDFGEIDSNDPINWAYLSFGTYDDWHNSNDGWEFTNIYLDGTLRVNGWEVDSGAWSLGRVTTFLDADHKLNVAFSRTGGDFGVTWVNIFGDYTEGRENTALAAAAPVPEPATMLLLGAGLIGTAEASRKIRFKR